MAATKVGRSNIVSGSAVVITASAYSAMDAVGIPFPLANATPNRGALLANAYMIESGSASGFIRAHFYSREPSAFPTTGMPYAVQGNSGYLGHADFTAWTSAHASAGMAQINEPNITLRGDDQSRVWVQYQALSGATFNADTNRLFLFAGLLQD